MKVARFLGWLALWLVTFSWFLACVPLAAVGIDWPLARAGLWMVYSADKTTKAWDELWPK